MGFLPDFMDELGPVFGRNRPAWMPPAYFVDPNGPTSSDKPKAHQSPFTRSHVFAALQALGAPDDAPPAPRAPDWMSLPSQRFSGQLDPRIAQPQVMAAPAWMQPYLWGGR